MAPADDEPVAKIAGQLDAVLNRVGFNLTDAALPALLAGTVPKHVRDRAPPVDDARMTKRATPTDALAEFSRPTVALAAFAEQAIQGWQGRERERRAAKLIRERAGAYRTRADLLLAETPDDPGAMDIHLQLAPRLDTIVAKAAFLYDADPATKATDLVAEWRKILAARALCAPDDVNDPVGKPIQTRLSALADAVNALEQASASLIGQTEPIDPDQHRRFMDWQAGFAGRVAALTKAAPANDAAVEKVAHQLHVALARIRRDLLDAELAMLLGVPVPNGNQGRDLAADDPRLLRRETISASLAEFARPTHVLDGYVDHARRQWHGSDRQRRAMRIVAGRAAEFLARVPTTCWATHPPIRPPWTSMAR